MKRVIIILFALLPIFAAAQNEGSSDGLINKGSGILYFEGRPNFDPTPFTDASEFAIDLNTKKVYVYSGSGSVWNRYNAIDTLSTLADTANVDNRIGQLVYVNSVDQYWHVRSNGFFYQLETGGGGTDDQTAAEVPLTPSGNLTSTNVQAGLQELQGDIDAGGIGQVVNVNVTADTVEVGPEYPYTLVYSQDFETDISTVTAFNGGTVIDSSANGGFLEIRGDNNARGAEFQYTHVANLDYTIRLDVRDVGNSGVIVSSQWAVGIATITLPGVYYINFTSPATAGAFGKEVIITLNTPTATPDTVKINSIHLYLRSDNANIYTKIETDALLEQKQDSIDLKISESRYFELSPVLYYNDFSSVSDITRQILSFNAIRTHSGTQMKIKPATTGTFGVYLYETLLKKEGYYWLYLDLEIPSGDTVTVSAQQGSSNYVIASGTGEYEVMLRANSFAGNFTDAIFVRSTDADSFYINEIRVIQFPDLRDFLFSDLGKGVFLGSGSDAQDSDGVAVGKNASARVNNLYGAAGGPERTAVGETAKALGWRATAIGGNAYAGTTSSTAVGAGATSLAVHGTAIGRGAYVPHPDSTNFVVNNVIGGDLAHSLYIANTWGHQFETPPGGIGISSYADPSTNETKIRGHDAYDARATPSSFNVGGGDFGIYAGLATGTGESGSINFYVGEGDNGQNTKDTPVKAGEFRSEDAATTDTHFWLLDASNGAMYKVKIGANNTGPGGSGRALYIDNN
jgi:hypothetical protein